MKSITLQAAANRRQRMANDRRRELIKKLNSWGVYEHGDTVLGSLNLVELENIHINEACRRGKTT